MWRLCVFAGLAVTLSTAGALAQTMQDAKRDGQTFGQAQAAVNQGAADTGAAAQSALPGYNGANAPETVYMATLHRSMRQSQRSLQPTRDTG
jgi:hypothetical protein